jgi:hypothetical protein
MTKIIQKKFDQKTKNSVKHENQQFRQTCWGWIMIKNKSIMIRLDPWWGWVWNMLRRRTPHSLAH